MVGPPGQLEVWFRRAPVAAFVTDGTGVLLACNERFAESIGRTVEEVVGSSEAELFGPELALRYRERFRHVSSTGEVLELVETFPSPGGQRTFTVVLFPLENHCMGGAVLDVTGRFSAQQAVDRQERTLKAVLETVNDGVWLVGRDWRTTYANPAMARLLGTTVEQLVGRAPTDFIRQQDVPAVEQQKRDREHGAAAAPTETLLVRQDGGLAWALASSAPLLDEKGQFDGAVAVLMDITEQKARAADRQRDEARRLEARRLESLGVLAGGIAHDFNNLLTGILGNLHLLRAELGPASAESFAIIEESTTRAVALTRQMLAYSGRGAFVMRAVDLAEVVHANLALVRSSIDSRHRLEVSLPTGLSRVMADASQLAQVVVNLVMNAGEAIGDRPGTITVSTARVRLDRAALDATYLAPGLPEGDYVELAVGDDGVGMTSDVQERLFEPFASTRGPGRGLGLPAVLGVVRGHRGTVRVVSERGRGTTVRLYLPFHEGASTAAPAAASAKVTPGRSILVVDDEALMRSTLRRMLARDGYLVEEAADGLEALERLKTLTPDLVLLDVSMPWLDGAATFLELRKRGATMPVVLMSGYSEQEALRGVLRDDLAGFLQKPFTPDALARALAAAFAR
ncbi:MAG: PAS domain-containing protein [Myxococcaceae bacterium]|nr:PAS domain-containing protein [Myxococcaceae bacterium]